MNAKMIEELLQNAKEREKAELLEKCKSMLLETDDDGERNRLALILSDHKADGTAEIIIQLLKSEKTAGNRGTLLYALGELDYTEHIDFIFDFILNGKSFEVNMEALRLIKKYLRGTDEKTIKKQIPFFVEKITDEMDELNEKMQFLTYAIYGMTHFLEADE